LRPTQILRRSRLVQLGAGSLMLAIPASAVALTANQADAQSALRINPPPRGVAYGRDVTISGNARPQDAGRAIQLEYVPAGAAGWRTVRTASVHRDGSFRFAEPFRRSGLVRVVAAADGLTASRGTVQGAALGGSAIAPSTAAPVSVGARFVVPTRPIDALAGQTAHVHGKLLPAVAGRRVRLLGRSGSSWRTLATARTGSRGGFDLHYAPAGAGQHWLRVRFRGDRMNRASWAHAGRVTAFRESVASWYADGGGTACGFHAYFGVAHKSLPCGTKVTFHYGGHAVTAVVDDRGPFVGGREWDLNQNTAGALGFGGVAAVWSSV
jgi:rare lipoprotein A